MKKQSPQVQLESLPPVEEVAQSIVDIAAAMKRVNSTRLKQDGVIILLQAQCGAKVNRTQLRLVLNELSRMDKAWLKPLEKKS
jgi:hypothetical protein